MFLICGILPAHRPPAGTRCPDPAVSSSHAQQSAYGLGTQCLLRGSPAPGCDSPLQLVLEIRAQTGLHSGPWCQPRHLTLPGCLPALMAHHPFGNVQCKWRSHILSSVRFWGITSPSLCFCLCTFVRRGVGFVTFVVLSDNNVTYPPSNSPLSVSCHLLPSPDS